MQTQSAIGPPHPGTRGNQTWFDQLIGNANENANANATANGNANANGNGNPHENAESRSRNHQKRPIQHQNQKEQSQFATQLATLTPVQQAMRKETSTPGPRSEKDDKYGLQGLLPIIRMTNSDTNTLSLGTDLTTLGLNLNSTNMLYATFAWPLADNPCKESPDWVLPHCYYEQPPPLKTSHLGKFTLETLFYIFYNMPKDTLQLYAAKELYNREWRYHKTNKLWLRKEKDEFIFFDVNAWERRVFRDLHLLDASNFMTEEELQAA